MLIARFPTGEGIKKQAETNKTHCCQIAKVQQQTIKLQSHKITSTTQTSN